MLHNYRAGPIKKADPAAFPVIAAAMDGLVVEIATAGFGNEYDEDALQCLDKLYAATGHKDDAMEKTIAIFKLGAALASTMKEAHAFMNTPDYDQNPDWPDVVRGVGLKAQKMSDVMPKDGGAFDGLPDTFSEVIRDMIQGANTMVSNSGRDQLARSEAELTKAMETVGKMQYATLNGKPWFEGLPASPTMAKITSHMKTATDGFSFVALKERIQSLEDAVNKYTTAAGFMSEKVNGDDVEKANAI
eukprot:8211870-Pyramimonas_sp.AAC.1